MINDKCGYLCRCYIPIPSFMWRPRLGAVTAVNCSCRFMHAFLGQTAPSKLKPSSDVSARLYVFLLLFYVAAKSYAQKTGVQSLWWVF